MKTIYKSFLTGFLILPIFLTSCEKDPVQGTVTDIEGNIYKTIKIGDQWWMAENLQTGQYRNGTVIPLVTDNSAWSNLTTPGYCWYENEKSTYGLTYGALYNWYTVETGNLCPTGWHVPTVAEWIVLTNFLGGLNVAGGKLKESGTTHWTSPNVGATNKVGFKALPGGNRSINGPFGDILTHAYWWTANDYDVTRAWARSAFYNNVIIDLNYFHKRNGFTVRCVKD